MSNARRLTLQLLANGKITVLEAEILLKGINATFTFTQNTSSFWARTADWVKNTLQSMNEDVVIFYPQEYNYARFPIKDNSIDTLNPI